MWHPSGNEMILSELFDPIPRTEYLVSEPSKQMSRESHCVNSATGCIYICLRCMRLRYQEKIDRVARNFEEEKMSIFRIIKLKLAK